MPSISDIRAQYPQYSDMSDTALAGALHSKFYSDMPVDQFNTKIGLGQQPAPQAAPTEDAPPIGQEIGSGISNAVGSAVKSVGDFLNPFSDARHASYAKQAAAPIGDAIQQNLQQIGGTGSAIATPLTAPGNVVGAVATPLIAHPFQALNQAAGIDQPYSQAKDQAATALMGLRPSGASPAGVTKTVPAVPTAAELKAAAKSVYNDPDIKSTPINANALSNTAVGAQSDLLHQGFRPTTNSAPGTFGELENLHPTTNNVTVDDLRASRRAFSKIAGTTDNFGRPTPDAAAATQVIHHIDSMLNSAAPELADANANYSAAVKSENFSLRGDRAQNNAAAANTGMNLENNLRTQVRQILNNPKLQRGYDPDTLAAFKAFNGGSKAANVMRLVGNAFGGGGGLGALVAGGIGHLVLPGGGEAAPAVGMALKAWGNARAANQFDKLGQMIRMNSPLAKSLPPVAAPPPNPLLGVLGAQQLRLPQILGMSPAYANQQQ